MHVFEEHDDRFYISWSTIENAGRGVFASRPIKAGEFLYISGVLVERGSEADRTTAFMNRYKFAALPVVEKYKILSYGKYNICPLGYAATVNHTGNKKLQNVEIRYLDCENSLEHADKAVYYFIKDVQKDEEILGNYGKSSNFDFMDKTINKRNVGLYRPILKKKAGCDV